MLDKQNVIVESLESPSGNRGLTEQVCHEVYVKMVDYLRLTQSKNTYNRFTDYHYLNIPVSNSTEPIRGIDYIQPIVAPGIDYATAVITKCLMPNGKINFEFERFSEADGDQARQARSGPLPLRAGRRRPSVRRSARRTADRATA